jgi:hypothetical protein
MYGLSPGLRGSDKSANKLDMENRRIGSPTDPPASIPFNDYDRERFTFRD